MALSCRATFSTTIFYNGPKRFPPKYMLAALLAPLDAMMVGSTWMSAVRKPTSRSSPG